MAGALSVTPAALTITADNQTKVYGAVLPTLTASYSGLRQRRHRRQPDDSANAEHDRDARQPCRRQPIRHHCERRGRYGLLDLVCRRALTVTPAALTITADNQTKVYGAALPTLTASYIGFVNGDTSANLTTQPTLSTMATAASHVAGSPYAINASGAADSDYSISYVAGTLTVTPAALTITADNETKVYGAALPNLTASYAGFVNGDTSASLTTQPTLSTTANAASHVSGSPYGITANGAVDSDYSISYVAGA